MSRYEDKCEKNNKNTINILLGTSLAVISVRFHIIYYGVSRNC